MSDTQSISEIKRYIPHRYPFLLVDRVVAYEPGVALKAIKNVTINEPFFNGHFPEKPVMPGVLMVEALAQTCGLLMAKILSWSADHSNICYLAGVDNARFRRVVEPGDQLEFRVEVVKQRSLIWKFSATASVEDQVACACDIVIAREK